MKSAILTKFIITVETILLIVGVVKFDVIGSVAEMLNKETEVYADEANIEEVTNAEVEDESEKKYNVTNPAANIVVKYLEGIYNISSLPESEKTSYLANWLVIDSKAYNFYTTNIEKITTADGKSIVSNFDIVGADTLESTEDLLKIRLNEKWIFENGEEKEFNNDYIIDTTYKTPIIKEIEMNELEDYILKYNSTDDIKAEY